MLLPPDPEARKKRLVGNLLNGFDRLHGQRWVTLIGFVILVVLLAMSILSI